MNDRNKNRHGYKETKVGWIPEEWSVTILDDICGQPVSGYSTNGSNRPAMQGEYGVLKLSCIQNGRFVPNENKLVTVHEISKLKTPVRKHTLLVSRSNTDDLVGAVCYVDHDAPNLFLSDLLWEVSVRNGAAVSTKWLTYLLCWKQYRSQILARANGTSGSMKKINKSNFLGICIPLPSFPDQKKIAEILSTWDVAIEHTRKLINAKKHRRKVLMQQVLTGKKRLPGFAKSSGRKLYQFFDLPEDWACPQIKEIAQECSGRNTGSHNLPVLTCSKHVGFVKSSEYFGKQVFSEETSSYKLIRRGWFGYPANHVEEGSIGLLLTHEIGLVSPIYIVFKCSDCVIPEYLFAVFKTDTFRHIFAISTNASVDRRGSLRWREFSLLRVPQPSIEEQCAIVEVLKSAENEVNLLVAKLKALEKQKRGLMQKLLTGEIRVKIE